MFNKISERVYYMECNGETDRPSIGLVVGDDDLLLFDAGNSHKHAKLILDSASKITDKKIKYNVLSHWHWDHVFGAHYIDAPILISHPKAKEVLTQMSFMKWDDASLDKRVEDGVEIPFCAEHIKKELQPFERDAIKIRLPNLTTANDLVIDLGGIQVTIFHIGGEHSEDSIAAYVSDGTVFLGDGNCKELYKPGDWSFQLNDFKERISKIERFPIKLYVNAHWEPWSRDEFLSDYNETCRIGELVGELLSVEDAEARYIKQYGKSPNDHERELFTAFVSGNTKKLK